MRILMLGHLALLLFEPITRKDTSVSAVRVRVCLFVELLLVLIYLIDLGLTYLCLGLRRYAGHQTLSTVSHPHERASRWQGT
jgi:hypothetical protein